MNQRLAERLYFFLQRRRGGVQRDQILFARQLLDRPWSEIQRHVADRLVALHGPAAAETGWLPSQRLVDRSELISRMKDVAGAVKSGVELRKTSGSTGTPFRFVKDVNMTAWMDAVMWAVYSWHGVRPGDRQARFWGAPLAKGAAAKRVILDRAQNRRRLSAFHIDQPHSVDFFHRMRRFRPTYAYGYPTLIDEFVRHCSAAGIQGRDLELRVVICTGELLLPAARDRIQQFFQCPVVNEYGCSESGVLAFECERGTLHMTPVAAFPEVVGDNGERAGEGVTGEVVVSDLYGSVEPLLRYRVHDRAARLDSHCACGRQLPSLAISEGRIDSFIDTPHRGRVYDAVLAYTVPPEVFRFRAHQVARDHLDVELVPGTRFDAESTPAECRRRWEAALGPGMRVSTRIVTEIPLTASGKLRYFVPLHASGVTTQSPPPAADVDS